MNDQEFCCGFVTTIQRLYEKFSYQKWSLMKSMQKSLLSEVEINFPAEIWHISLSLAVLLKVKKIFKISFIQKKGFVNSCKFAWIFPCITLLSYFTLKLKQKIRSSCRRNFRSTRFYEIKTWSAGIRQAIYLRVVTSNVCFLWPVSLFRPVIPTSKF